MLRRLGLFLLAAALVLPSSAASISAASADTPLPDPLIATGKLLNQAGQLVANARLQLDVWPNQTAISSLSEGDVVNTVTAATGVTDSTGQFALRLPDLGGLLATLGLAAGEDVNFTLSATGSGEYAAYSFSRSAFTRVVGDTVRNLLLDPMTLLETPLQTILGSLGSLVNYIAPINGIVLNFGGGSTGPDSSLDDAAIADPSLILPEQPPYPEVDESAPNGSTVVVEADPTYTPKACFNVYESNLGNAWTVIGEHQSRTVNAGFNMKYIKESRSTLGVAVSNSGSFGSFSASGTSSWTTSSTQTFSTVSGKAHNWRRTLHTWGKFSVWCASGTTSSKVGYQARVIGYAGGDGTVFLAGDLTATYCVAERAGDTFTLDRTAAKTVSGGAQTAGNIGIGLSAQTGYTTTASVVAKFSGNGRLCGTNGYPGSTPKILVAKAPA